MIERGQHPSLSLEPAAAFGVASDRIRQHLDREIALEPMIASTVDFPHCAGAERRNDLVRANPRTGRNGHVSVRGTLACLSGETVPISASIPFGVRPGATSGFRTVRFRF